MCERRQKKESSQERAKEVRSSHRSRKLIRSNPIRRCLDFPHTLSLPCMHGVHHTNQPFKHTKPCCIQQLTHRRVLPRHTVMIRRSVIDGHHHHSTAVSTTATARCSGSVVRRRRTQLRGMRRHKARQAGRGGSRTTLLRMRQKAHRGSKSSRRGSRTGTGRRRSTPTATAGVPSHTSTTTTRRVRMVRRPRG